ncbi:MAG: SDR family oxidoreductase [Myxococcota bacterium]|jgi:3-oxoacyl-[acyl-carrier protein] reductase|nr:SDR family oxidoreductase [Myxococcota bacterium]
MSQAGCRFDYSGSRVLVTGGSNGIGAGVAGAFRAAGADVVITGTRDSAGDYDHDLSGYEYHSLQVKSPEEIEDLAGRLGRLDVLVNNAGASLPGGRNEWEPDVFEESVAINLFGAFRMSIACKELLAASAIPGGGSVINLASMSSYIAVPMVPGYGAAKAGIVQMTLNLAVTWVGEGIRVNAVAPGLVESNMTAVMKGIEALEKPQMDRTPMGRWGLPSDIAPSILFLASEEASFITGQTLNVDGGYSVA